MLHYRYDVNAFRIFYKRNARIEPKRERNSHSVIRSLRGIAVSVSIIYKINIIFILIIDGNRFCSIKT